MEFTVEVKTSDIESERLLVETAALGDLKTVTTLLESGISVDAEEYNKTLFYASKNYMTPLQLACSNDHLAVVEKLIEYEANVDAKDRFDVTAMHMAAEKGNVDCLKALLSANAKCSCPTKCSKMYCYTAVPYIGGSTPLHLAAERNRTECVKELIQYGADYNAVDEFGRTSLYIAAQFGFSECLLAHLKNAVGRDILSLPSVETEDTPLHFAVNRGMVECVKALCACGSDANHMNLSGYSPLHLAVNPTNDNISSCMELLEILVIEGYQTNVNQPDYLDNTPLHYTCFNGRSSILRRRPEMAKFLIAYGANVNIKSIEGHTLLEGELKLWVEDHEILYYIIRSMLHLPRLSKLRVVPLLPEPPREEPSPDAEQPNDMIEFVMQDILRARSAALEAPPKREKSIYPKHIWYENIASNPRTLQHYCRYAIRKALGPFNIKYITKLPVPNKVMSYLFLEYGD